MERFKNNGHISDYGFTVLLSNSEDTLAALELSEHISFCDECCGRYANLLCDDVLISPPVPIAKTVISRLKNTLRLRVFNKYCRAGIAACLAMALWFGGINSGVITVSSTEYLQQDAGASYRESIEKKKKKSEKSLEKYLGKDSDEDLDDTQTDQPSDISSAINNFITNSFKKGDTK